MTEQIIRQIAQEHGTPFFLYDLQGMAVASERLYRAFPWAEQFRNFFAIKALPRLEVIRHLRHCGSGVECCSAAELELAKRGGFSGGDVIYTCLFPSKEEVRRARALRAMVNLDWAEDIDTLLRSYKPNTLFFRLNPGDLVSGSRQMGVPGQSKFGSLESQLVEAYRTASTAGVERLGLHGMFASNMLRLGYFMEAATVLFETVARIERKACVRIDHINLGEE